jgi:hypothetical protein
MRTLFAVVLGLAVAALIVLAGRWGLESMAEGSATLSTVIVALCGTFFALTAGAFTAMRIGRNTETLAGFMVGELFFGTGLLHRFWHSTAWYNLVALLLVVPAAALGSWLASRLGPGARGEDPKNRKSGKTSYAS